MDSAIIVWCVFLSLKSWLYFGDVRDLITTLICVILL